MKKMLEKRKICMLNTYIDNLTQQETVEEVEQYIIHEKPLHLMGVNADKIIMLNKDKKFQKIVNGCSITNADGASVVLASKVLGMPLKERVAGIDLMDALIKRCNQQGYEVFLLGAKLEVVDKTKEVLCKKYKNLNIVGTHDGYFDREQWCNIGQIIKESKAKIVFVGITSPLKEYFIEFLQEEGLHCVFMGVGGSFDVISGMIKRAPVWMQRSNLEWLYRVMQEPKRLFKRYFIGNSKFILAVIREKYRKRGYV